MNNKSLSAEEKWDLIIEPKKTSFNLNLKEVWQYRDLLLLFVKRDFTAQYKQTILGPLWHFIQPLFTTLVFLIIFNKIANISTDGLRPVLFYMSGITIWNYFSNCFTATSNSFVNNAAIFGKVYFPRLVIPLSSIISNLLKFAIQFLLLFTAIIYYVIKGDSFSIQYTILLIPFLVLIMAGLGLGLGIIISSLTTKYRDLNVLIVFGVQLLMYATPIAYPVSFLQNKSYALFIKWNPLTPIVEAFRYSIFQKGTFSIYSIGYSILFMLIVLLCGILIFNRVEKTFMDTV